MSAVPHSTGTVPGVAARMPRKPSFVGSEEGLVQIRQSLAARQTMGGELGEPYRLALLAEVQEKRGEVEEGLTVLADALVDVDNRGECWWKAELYPLKGQLTLQKFQVPSSKFRPTPNP
jgi:hypothetical protein